MGVRGGFWKGYLHGRRVAVDLSAWIVSAMSTNSPTRRNIFFRTLSLFSKMGAFPVFVLDGTPSPLKARATSDAFTRCVHDCVQLPGHLRMPILRAKGEAEALCAQLHRDGDVDACITSDSDAFLCGANIVIKVFRSTAKKPFDCYNMADIQDGIGLGRKRMIAMAPLLGCDYDLQGVPGVGLETALAFVQLFHEEHILDELRAIGNGIYPPAALASQCPSFDKWLKGREKSGANRNRLLVPNEEKSGANNISKTSKGARPRPRPSWMQLGIKDFYRAKKPRVEMGETSTRKSSPVSQRRRLLLG